MIRPFSSAARALERDGQEEIASLLLARFHRDQGRSESAAKHFESAGRLVEAARAEGGEVAPPAEFHGAAIEGLEPEQLEGLLADSVLNEFKTRLGRIGLDYQTPSVPTS